MEPGRRAVSKPRPISTPFAACTLMSACASRPSSFRSHWAWLPSPGGRPVTTVSTTPPSVSPLRLHSSIRSMMRRSASGSAMRTGDAADLGHPAVNPDAEGLEQTLREPADGDARRRLARARALEDVAHVAVVVLERAGEVGVARPRARHRQPRVAILGPRRHLLLPVHPVAVLDPEGDRRAQRLAPAHPRPQLRLVALDLHPAATTVTAHAPGQVSIDRLDVDGHPGREALDDGGQTGPVRLPGGEVAECHPCLTRPAAAPPTGARQGAAGPLPATRPSA